MSAKYYTAILILTEVTPAQPAVPGRYSDNPPSQPATERSVEDVIKLTVRESSLAALASKVQQHLSIHAPLTATSATAESQVRMGGNQ